MDLNHVSPKRFASTITWAIIASAVVVTIVAGLARAGINLQSALVDKPDIAVFILLKEELEPEDAITGMPQEMRSEATDSGQEQLEYYIETTTGPKHVTLRKGETEWYLHDLEWLRPAPSEPQDQ